MKSGTNAGPLGSLKASTPRPATGTATDASDSRPPTGAELYRHPFYRYGVSDLGTALVDRYGDVIRFVDEVLARLDEIELRRGRHHGEG